MAMYYYASKLSAVACGLRCKQQQHRRHHRRRKGSVPGATSGGGSSDDDEDEMEVFGGSCRRKSAGEDQSLDEILRKKWNDPTVASSLANLKLGHQPTGSVGGHPFRSGSRDEAGGKGVAATSSIIEYHGNYKELPSNQDNLSAAALAQDTLQSHAAVLGPNGVMYLEGRVVSGPLDSLVKLLLPLPTTTTPPKRLADELDEEYIFSFLLSSRIFLPPQELLGRLLVDIMVVAVPEVEDHNAISPLGTTTPGVAGGTAEENLPALECLVKFLGVWTTKFPYDFRDERIMSHVKHIVAKCANNELNDIVSELLCALLTRLTDLEQHEEDLRASLSPANTEMGPTRWVSSSHLAQLLSRIERKLAKHVGAEEFVQCNANVLQKTTALGMAGNSSSSSSSGYSSATAVGRQGPKKTCNLETYLDWSLKLKMLVMNDILQTTDLSERVKMVELWSGAAQYCLLVGNYNSSTAILEALDHPAIVRLTQTWDNLVPMSQQLSCMYRHAEGHGDLWSKQTKDQPPSLDAATMKPVTTPQRMKLKRSGEWVVIPVFKDIVRLAMQTREECSRKIGNDHLNVQAFDRMAAIVGAFAKHMKNVSAPQPTVDGEFELIFRQMNNCSLLGEADLMAASCALEPDLGAYNQPSHPQINLQDYS